VNVIGACFVLQAISGKVDGYDAADLRVLLDRAALSAARRAIDQPQSSQPSAAEQAAGRQVSDPLANGHAEPPHGALQARAGALQGFSPAALPVRQSILRTILADLGPWI